MKVPRFQCVWGIPGGGEGSGGGRRVICLSTEKTKKSPFESRAKAKRLYCIMVNSMNVYLLCFILDLICAFMVKIAVYVIGIVFSVLV